jgi:WD40 repeat protein
MNRCRMLVVCTVLLLTLSVDAGQDPPAAKDVYGDPLPAGAVMRLGQLPRWRHDALVAFAAFLPDGKSVLTVGHDGAIHIWEYPSGKEIRRIPAPPRAIRSMNAVALSADGKTIAISFVCAGDAVDEYEIRLHQVATGKELACLKVESGAVVELAFSPNGKHLTSQHADNVVRIWDWANTRELSKVAMAGPPPAGGGKGGKGKGGFGPGGGFGPIEPGISRKDLVFAYAPDGKTLMICGSSGLPRFVDLASGKEIAVAAPAEAMTSIWFSANGKYLLTQQTNGLYHKWDAASGKDLGPIAPAKPEQHVVISPDGRFAARWPASSLMPKGKKAGEVGPAQEVHLVDLASGKEIGKITGLPAGLPPAWLLFSPNGKVLAIKAPDESKIDLYDVATAKLLRTLLVPSDAAGSSSTFGNGQTPTMLFSSDGKMLAFQRNVGATAIVLFDVATGKQIGSVGLQAQEDPPAFKGKGGKGKGGKSFPNAKSPGLGALSPDGRCLALVQAGAITLYELAAGQPRLIYGDKLPAAAAPGGSRGPLVAFAPDGKVLAYAGLDGIIYLVDVATGKVLAAFKGHDGAVLAVAFAGNGKMVASVSADTTALLWDVSKLARPQPAGKPLQPGDIDQWWLALSADDAGKAFEAMRALAAVPKDAVAWIKDKVKPVAAADARRIEELIFQLDDDQFKVRYKAVSELLQIGEPILPALDKALLAGPTLETKRRLEELRSLVGAGLRLHGERLRVFRAVEVLEMIGTAEARQVLQKLAEGAPGALLTVSAQAALKR